MSEVRWCSAPWCGVLRLVGTVYSTVQRDGTEPRGPTHGPLLWLGPGCQACHDLTSRLHLLFNSFIYRPFHPFISIICHHCLFFSTIEYILLCEQKSCLPIYAWLFLNWMAVVYIRDSYNFYGMPHATNFLVVLFTRFCMDVQCPITKPVRLLRHVRPSSWQRYFSVRSTRRVDVPTRTSLVFSYPKDYKVQHSIILKRSRVNW